MQNLNSSGRGPIRIWLRHIVCIVVLVKKKEHLLFMWLALFDPRIHWIILRFSRVCRAYKEEPQPLCVCAFARPLHRGGGFTAEPRGRISWKALSAQVAESLAVSLVRPPAHYQPAAPPTAGATGRLWSSPNALRPFLLLRRLLSHLLIKQFPPLSAFSLLRTVLKCTVQK